MRPRNSAAGAGGARRSIAGSAQRNGSCREARRIAERFSDQHRASTILQLPPRVRRRCPASARFETGVTGLIIAIAVAELLLGRDAEGQIIGQIRELNGEQGATAIEATVRSARMLHTDFGWDPFFRKEPGAEFPTGCSQRR